MVVVVIVVVVLVVVVVILIVVVITEQYYMIIAKPNKLFVLKFTAVQVTSSCRCNDSMKQSAITIEWTYACYQSR